MKPSAHILVIEDDEIARGSVVRALEDAGYKVTATDNGQAGLDSALAVHPDLILSDNLMPLRNGTEVLAELRADSWGSQVPFILLTSQFSLEAVNDSLEAGNTDVLVKDDTSLSDIVQAVAKRLGA